MKVYKDEVTGKVMTKDAFIKVLRNIIYSVTKENFGELKVHIFELEVQVGEDIKLRELGEVEN